MYPFNVRNLNDMYSASGKLALATVINERKGFEPPFRRYENALDNARVRKTANEAALLRSWSNPVMAHECYGVHAWA